MGKADYFNAMMHRDHKMSALEPSDVNIRMYGDVAVVTETLRETGESQVKPYDHTSRVTTVD